MTPTPASTQAADGSQPAPGAADSGDPIVRYLSDPNPEHLDAAALALRGLEIPGPALSARLHAAACFADADSGRAGIAAPIGFNQHRQVVIRTPAGYDPERAWPLIVLYHSWGGSADRMLDRLETILGDRIEQFVVAAPDATAKQ